MNKNLLLVLLSFFRGRNKKREYIKILIDDNSSNIWSNNLINLNVAYFLRLCLNVEYVVGLC